MLAQISSEFLKWNQTYKVAIFTHLSYKVDFLLTAIVPGIIFFLVKYSLYSTAYSTMSLEVLQGYTLKEMLQYHYWVFAVSILAKGHDSVNLALEIRKGRISTYLVRPFHFWKYHSCTFLAYQTLQIVPFIFILSASLLFNWFEFVSLHFFQGLLICLFVSTLWFLIQFTIGLLAFWLEETWSLRAIFMILSTFLSGGFLPLELFPEFFVKILKFTPFPHLTYVPARYFLGKPTENGFGLDILILVFWIFFPLSYYIWSVEKRYKVL